MVNILKFRITLLAGEDCHRMKINFQAMVEMTLQNGDYQRVLFKDFRMDVDGKITTIAAHPDSPYLGSHDDLIGYLNMAFTDVNGDKNYHGW